MTRENIIRMANEAGATLYEGELFTTNHGYRPVDVATFTKFAQLIAAEEREACAKVAENRIQNAADWDSSYWDQCCSNVAFAIRARGQQ